MKHIRFLIVSFLVVFLLVAIVSAEGEEVFNATVDTTANLTPSYSGATGYVKVAIQGNTSVDNIDQSFTTAPDNTQEIGSSFNYMVGQGFTSNKTHLTNVSFLKSASTGTPTGDIIVAIRTVNATGYPSTTILSSYTIPKATWDSYADGAEITVPIPTLLSPDTVYYITWVSSATETGSNEYRIKQYLSGGYSGGFATYTINSDPLRWTQYGSDSEFKTYYSENTEDVNFTINGVSLGLISNGSTVGNPNGILPNQTINTYNSMINYTTSFNSTRDLSAIYSADSGGNTTIPFAVNDWSWYNQKGLQSATDTTTRSIVYIVNSPLPFLTLDISTTLFNNNVLIGSIDTSPDGTTWTNRWNASASTSAQTGTVHITGLSGNTQYVRLYKNSANGYIRWDALAINGTVDTATTNLTPLPWNNGANYVNVTTGGRAVSSSLDPSNRTQVFLYKEDLKIPISTFTSVNITPATNSTSYGWEGLAPFTMQFTSTSLGSPTSYVWNYTKLGSTTPVTFNQSTFSSPIYTFPSSGNYSIQLNVTNGFGSNQSIQTTWVNVTTPAPTSYFTANVSSGPTPLPVLFTDLSPGFPDTWNWSVDEGTGIQWFNLTDPLNHDLTYTFVPVRSSRVNLTVANISTASDYSTSSMNITVTNQPPVASFVKNNTYGTTGTVFQFNDTSTGNGITGWNWSFTDGNVSSTRNVTHQFPLGTYNVNLTVTNDGGSSTSIQTVYVSAFTSSYTANSTLGVVPIAVLFSETSTGLLPDSYYWEFGDGGTDTVQNPTHVYSTIGTFTVSHRITNGTSVSWVNTTNMIKTEIGNLSVTFTTSNTTSIDVPLVVLFTPTVTATNASPVSYTWNFGDGSPISTDAAPVHTYSSYGSFIATMNATNVTGKLWSNKTSSTLTYGSAYPNNASHNFVLNQMYPTTIRVKDSNTLALIGGSQITDDAGLKTTLNNGVLSTSYSYGSHTFTVEATGYYTKTTSEFVTSNSTFTILLDPQNGGTQNVWWTPHVVQVTLMDAAYQTRLSDVNLSATYNQSSMPTEWLTQLYGIQNGPAGNMIDKSLVMGGITGSDGTITLTMLGSLKYDIYLNSVAYGLNNYHVSAYPSDSMLNIYVPISGSTLPTNGNSTYVYLNNTRLYITQPNISYVSMCIDYQDLSGTTSTVTEL